MDVQHLEHNLYIIIMLTDFESYVYLSLMIISAIYVQKNNLCHLLSASLDNELLQIGVYTSASWLRIAREENIK